MRSLALSIIGIDIDSNVPGLASSSSQDGTPVDAAASSRPRAGGLFSYFNSRVRARPNKMSHSSVFDIDEDLSVVHPVDPTDVASTREAEEGAIGYEIDEDAPPKEEEKKTASAVPPSVPPFTIASKVSSDSKPSASNTVRSTVACEHVDRMRIDVRQLHELIGQDISLDSIQNSGEFEEFMTCSLESSEAPVVTIALFKDENVIGRASISVPHTSMLAQRIIVGNIAFTVRLQVAFEDSKVVPAQQPLILNMDKAQLAKQGKNVSKIIRGAIRDTNQYFYDKFWSFYLLFMVILLSLYLGNGHPRTNIPAPHIPIAFPRSVVLSPGMQIHGGCTYTYHITTSASLAPSSVEIAAVTIPKSFEDVVQTWFKKAFHVETVENKCAPSYLVLEESGELAILSILNRGNTPVALWRSSNYDSIAPAPAPAVADEKSVPWWRRVLLSPYRFVKRQILKRRDPQDDRVIPMQITASCEADNKVIIRSGNHVKYEIDLDEYSELRGVITCI